MDKVFELLATICQMYLWIWFITKFLGLKKNNIFYKTCFISMWILSVIFITFLNNIIVYDGFLTGIVTISYIIYAFFCLKGSKGAKIFICLYSTAILFTISTVVLFLFAQVSGFSLKSHIMNLTYRRIIIIFICRMLEYLIFKFVIRINADYKFTKKEWILFALLPLFTWLTITLITHATIEPQKVLPLMFYVALIMVGVDIIIYFFMFKIKDDERQRLKYELEIAKQMNITKMAESIKVMEDNAKTMKHDTEKHYIAIRTLAKKNESKKIIDYVDRYITKNLNCEQRIYTENDIFDSIINTYLDLCAQKDIEVIVNISKEAVSHIDPFDVSVLFGNIFENAIEATAHASNKLIIFDVQGIRSYVNIRLENTFDKEFSNLSLETTKADKENHGLGTKSVRKLVEEKGGNIQFNVNKYGMFCCDILYKRN